tara:strand:- start:11117 stop:11491 length:375 start_codon:yes stop_codon:yes gene_type:complete
MLPIFFENSRIPKLLSKIAPFEVGGFAFFIFVWTRGVATQRLRSHETTHWKQQLECLFVAQWIMYALMWVLLLAYHRDTYLAYRMSAFEIEAYEHQDDPTYNDQVRKPFAWVKYIPRSFERVKK